MNFIQDEVPVAYSMVELVEVSPQHYNKPLQDFICYWMAFNNVYTVIAERKGQQIHQKKGKDGSLKTIRVGSVYIPKVQMPREREQLDLAYSEFGDDLKDGLITHESMTFFVYRSPVWQGSRVQMDAFGQRLNGVLNVGHTINATCPVWSPIDIQAFEKYTQGQKGNVIRDALAKQILDMLYTVRNNIVHAGKKANDANDCEVAEKALPLLRMILDHFINVAG